MIFHDFGEDCRNALYNMDMDKITRTFSEEVISMVEEYLRSTKKDGKAISKKGRDEAINSNWGWIYDYEYEYGNEYVKEGNKPGNSVPVDSTFV